MTKILLATLALTLFVAGGCSRDNCSADLQRRERTLAHALDSVLVLRVVSGPDRLRANLEDLRARELVLLDDARRCDFGGDVMGSHYWKRGRLKFPSRIELALQELNDGK